MHGESRSSRFADWLVTLDALQEANLKLKQDLTRETRRVNGSTDLLEALEAFLVRSLNKDLHIALLRQDVMMFERQAGLDDSPSHFQNGPQKLGQDVAMMCEQFAKLKEDFSAQFGGPAPVLNSASSSASVRSGL